MWVKKKVLESYWSPELTIFLKVIKRRTLITKATVTKTKRVSNNTCSGWPFYNCLVMGFVALVNKVGAHTSIISGFSFPMLPSPKSSFPHLNQIVHSLSAILSFLNLNETRQRKDFTFSKTNEALSSSWRFHSYFGKQSFQSYLLIPLFSFRVFHHNKTKLNHFTFSNCCPFACWLNCSRNESK